jgi:hypothetical protein
MSLNLGGWVGDFDDAHTICTGPRLYPISGLHFQATELWFNNDQNWYEDDDCDDPADIGATELDLCTVIIHEWGHMIGIGHPCQNELVVMCPTLSLGKTRRTLRHDDITHLEETYACHTPPSSGCL